MIKTMDTKTMNTHTSTSCIRFMESLESKMNMMMRTGDVTDGSRERRSPEEIDELCVYARRLITEGMTIKAAAKQAGLQITVLRRRLIKNER